MRNLPDLILALLLGEPLSAEERFHLCTLLLRGLRAIADR